MSDNLKAWLENLESKSLYAVMHLIGKPSLLNMIRYSTKEKAQIQERLESQYWRFLSLSSLSNQQDLSRVKVQAHKLRTLLLDLNTQLVTDQADEQSRSNDA